MFLFQIAFESSEYIVRCLGFREQNTFECQIPRDQRSRFFKKVQEQADDSKNLRRETLYISVYECVNISTFALLDVKLWLEEDGNVNTHHPLYSFIFIQSRAKN